MARPVFKSYLQGQSVLFPASLDEKLPPDSPARLINDIVDNLDISRVIDTYKFGGRSAYHPRMMLKVVIYWYLSLESAYIDGTKIESRANRYTFVWRKSVEKHKAKLEEKIRKVLE
ncbi:MAG TPA: IS5/IS1182 family transposase, partial [Porphyromonadaceae bacterium]|nr:IS5/IS1182 family transposase [Porphyromonadaceae bacterium]